MAITPVVDSIADGGFEQPALAANAYQTDPSGSAWQFSGTAGVSQNGSDFVTNWVVKPRTPPRERRWPILQGNGSMSQTVYLDAGTYEISFLAAQRAIYQTHYQEIEVLVDAAVVGTRSTPLNTLYGSYQTSTFTVAAAGAHTITFLGLNPLGGDNTAFIDQVTLDGQRHHRRQLRDAALAAGTYQYAPAGSPWQFSASGRRQPAMAAPSPPAIPMPPTARRSPSSRATAA